MGIIIKAQSFSSENQGIIYPIIYCYSSLELEKQAVSINQLLAKKIKQCNPKWRSIQLERCLYQVVASLPDKVIIKNFDVLFNPSYKVDVLQIMRSICKSKPFQVIWPGRYQNGMLYYSEDRYPDYKTYDINNYDITCVIKEETPI